MNIDNTRAAYRVLDPNGFYVDDALYSLDENGEPMCIYFDGVPNEQLEPLNELAHDRLNSYLEHLDSLAKTAAEKMGRPFVGRPRNLDGALELATMIQKEGQAIMGVRRETSTVERIESHATPETGRKRGRPLGSVKKAGPAAIKA